MVSVDEVQKNLGSIIEEAAAGEHIVITRHGRPVASLIKAGLDHAHVGARTRCARLRPLLKAASNGAYLEVLAVDRRSVDGHFA